MVGFFGLGRVELIGFFASWFFIFFFIFFFDRNDT